MSIIIDTDVGRVPHARSPLIDGPVLPTLARMAVPNTLANLLMIIPMLVEAWRLAELGASALAGVALVFPLFMLMTMWSAGSVGGAVSGAVARAVGAGNISQAEAIARSTLVIGLGGALFMAALVFGGGQWLFSILGGAGPVLDTAWAYASVLFAFSVIIWLFNMMSSVMRGTGDMVKPLLAIAVISFLHTVASGPIILGIDGANGYGVKGAAALLVASYGAGFIVLFFFFCKSTAAVRLRLGSIDWNLTGQLLRPGLLAATQSLITIITSMILASFATRYGQNVLAGYGLGARIELLMIPLIFGVGGASIALGGAATGAGMHKRAVQAGWITAGIAAVFVGGIGGLLALSAEMWASEISSNAAISSVIIGYMERVGPIYAFFAVGLALFFTSQGTGTLLYPVLGTVVRFLVVLAGGYLIFARESPSPNDLFFAIAVGMASYGVFVSMMLWLGPWRDLKNGSTG